MSSQHRNNRKNAILMTFPLLILLLARSLAADTVLTTVAVGSLPVELAVSPAGDRVYVSNAGDGTISVINTSTFAVTRVPITATGLQGIAVSPDNSKVYVASLDAGSIHILNVSTLTESAPVPVSPQPIEVVFDPTGTFAYVTDLDQGLYAVNTTTHAVLHLQLHDGARGITVVNVPGVGKRIYVAIAGSTSEIAVVNPSNATVQYVPVSGDPFGLTSTLDGRKVYASLSELSATAVLMTTTNTVSTPTIRDAGGFPFGIADANTPSGERIFVADFSGNGISWDVSRISPSSDTLIGQLFVGRSPRGVAASPDGRRVYVANSGSNTVTVIDTTH